MDEIVEYYLEIFSKTECEYNEEDCSKSYCLVHKRFEWPENIKSKIRRTTQTNICFKETCFNRISKGDIFCYHHTPVKYRKKRKYLKHNLLCEIKKCHTHASYGFPINGWRRVRCSKHREFDMIYTRSRRN